MQRRGFLGLFAGAVAAKPDPSLLFQPPAGLDMNYALGGIVGSEIDSIDRFKSLKDRLKKLVGMSKAAEAAQIRQTYINGFDPDTAALVSMSNVAKMRRTRVIQYRARKAQEIGYIGAVFDKLID